ncbi:hypothetical protein P4529_18230 [Virgibacillus pantothenticus]|nr:hypothetical protein [Virgibacillus pantothenticus]
MPGDEPMMTFVGRISKVASLLDDGAGRGYSVITLSTSTSLFYAFV